ncbi:hypothetical protein A3Q56_01046 [Intoshia linei]|uniref:Uncharacterized protein n=1 Tax=Intoshia linei TaxID=1819745 RepID=A0A177BA61_9BILA|nr:hypothetical protein A3Q56_01046 [Intoshia linei]
MVQKINQYLRHSETTDKNMTDLSQIDDLTDYQRLSQKYGGIGFSDYINVMKKHTKAYAMHCR